MDPNDIELSNLSKSFEYAKFSSEIEKINDVDELKTLLRCYFKLYLKQQEVVASWATSNP
jgi:hypothetical protein